MLNMLMSAPGATFIRLQEGFVDHYYLDAVNVGTIGIGFTAGSEAFMDWWHRNKPGQKFGPGARMTRAEAESALQYVNQYEYGQAVNKFLKNPVTQNVFDGMLSPVFNCGRGSLKWGWAAEINAGHIDKGAELLKGTATTAKGKILKGLVRRRKEEALLISKGVYTGVNTVLVAMPVPVQAEVDAAMADGILMRGESGPAVRKLIHDLTQLGYYNGTQDDVFGRGTEAAVLTFQRANKLLADGWAGETTLGTISRQIAA